ALSTASLGPFAGCADAPQRISLRPRVFITQPVAKSAIERLRSVAEVEWNPDAVHIMTQDELCAAVREHDVLFCLLQDRIDAGVIAANPKLRAIASMKITPSDIDVAAATARWDGERAGSRCASSIGARGGFPRVKSGKSASITSRWTNSWPSPTSSRSTPRRSPRRII